VCGKDHFDLVGLEVEPVLFHGHSRMKAEG
jgi:hypothetical protein